VTDPARRRNIAEALARAAQALAVADAALAIGSAADAVSRAYYGALHHLRALLFARGLEARTHAGAQHLFNQEFVQNGLFPATTNRLLASLQRMREIADYDPATVFDTRDTEEQIRQVRAFGQRVEQLLRGEGLLDDAS
jgi:uncharacterized protein (UPF0332 family)